MLHLTHLFYGQASGLEKELQAQLAEAEARRKGLEALRLEVAAAREGAAEAKAAEAAVRNEAAQFLREQLELEVQPIPTTAHFTLRELTVSVMLEFMVVCSFPEGKFLLRANR